MGWSRGAVTVVYVARQLEKGCYNPVKGTVSVAVSVKWLGMIDAVNQTNHSNWSDTTLPANVQVASHAKKSGQQSYVNPYGYVFPTLNYVGAAMKYNRIFYKEDSSTTTHNEMGVGWALAGGGLSNKVLDWLKNQAKDPNIGGL